MNIPVTQYLAPGGTTKEHSVPVSDELGALANEVIEAGGRFTAEMLMTGHISIACEAYNPEIEEESDVAIEVCHNNEAVFVALEKVIRNAHKFIFTEVKG